jgi:hypothetical protein
MNDTVSEDVKLGDDKLREILAGCEGVTPGPWEAGHHWVFVPPEDAANHPTMPLRSILRDVPESELQPNAHHIARLDPQTVASIVTELLERRAYLAATKPPEDHETCALCGLPAPDGYVEFDADGEAMHPHCRDAATKPPLADVTVEEIERIVLATEPDVPASVDGSTIWTRRMASALHARLYASPPMPGRGEGFVLVPVEPDAAMKQACMDVLLYRGDIYAREDGTIVVETITPRDLWREMLAASRPKEDTHAK